MKGRGLDDAILGHRRRPFTVISGLDDEQTGKTKSIQWILNDRAFAWLDFFVRFLRLCDFALTTAFIRSQRIWFDVVSLRIFFLDDCRIMSVASSAIEHFD